LQETLLQPTEVPIHAVRQANLVQKKALAEKAFSVGVPKAPDIEKAADFLVVKG